MSSVVEMPSRRGLVASVAENVRVECARKGWKQSNVARVLKTSATTVSARWMGVRPWQLEDLELLANALAVPVERLLLPRLDSNQEPSDSPFALVIDMFTRERVA